MAVAVRIRMKMMGRTHRKFFRIVVTDKRQPRDGRAIEEVGTYDPHVPDTDKRVTLIPSRIKYWQSVGAKASDNVEVFLKKYMAKFEAIEAQEAADKEAAMNAPPAEAPAQA